MTRDFLEGRDGRPLLPCPDCGGALAAADVFEHGLRLPDVGESREDYFEAELLDELPHVSCLRLRAGRTA